MFRTLVFSLTVFVVFDVHAVSCRLKAQYSPQVKLALKSSNPLADLKALLVAEESREQRSIINMTVARLYFEKKNWKEAIEHYKAVPQDSDFWFIAREELTWSYAKAGMLEEVLANGTTLTAPKVRSYLGAETMFLLTFAQIQTCDYSAASKSIDLFKSHFKERTRALMKSSKICAKLELKEITGTLKKMHVLEAELMQQLALAASGKKNKKSGGADESIGKYDLKFPYNEGEVWFDELNNYRANMARVCGRKYVRASL